MSTPREVPAELAQARVTIDNIDAALVHLLAERFRCTQNVGHIKAKFGLAPADPKREEQQVARLRALAEVIRHHEVIKREYNEDGAAQS